MNNPNPQRDEPLGGYRGFNLKNLTLFTFIFFISRCNISKAVDSYHEYKTRTGNKYICPYKTKTGSCSETLRTEGFIALAKKCHQHRIESCGQ